MFDSTSSEFGSRSRRCYLGWTRQLTHSNKHIRIEYFESSGAPTTPLCRRIFLPTFVTRPWWFLLHRYCGQHTTFARIISLSSILVMTACIENSHKDSRLLSSFRHISHHIYSLLLFLHGFLCAKWFFCQYCHKLSFWHKSGGFPKRVNLIPFLYWVFNLPEVDSQYQF